MYAPIKDYFLIGDLQPAALVSKNAAIEWLCLPYFDCPSIFAALLDDRKGGTFSVDAADWTTSAKYVEETAIVETEFKKKDAAFVVRDFMLPRPTEDVVPHYLIRKVVGKRGTPPVRFVFDPRQRYARQPVNIQERGRSLLVRLGDRTLWLHLPRGATVERRKGKRAGVIVSMEVKKGETKELVMEYSIESRLRFQMRDFESEPRAFWKNWIEQGTFFDFRRDQLVRSAITLKMMQFYPTGGLVAAPTTSLPEWIGGIRNWDYRFVWIRDATFTLYAFFVLGFREEAEKLFRFVEAIAEEEEEIAEDDLEVSHMYTIWGQQPPQEESLTHLAGYRNSKPVRIGNGAKEQFQLDTYGSLLDAYYFMAKKGVPISDRSRRIIFSLIRKIEKRWKEPENGIWEVRCGLQQFTYGRVMAWVGIDRAIKIAEQLKLKKKEIARLEKLRREIERWIWANCFDRETETFRQHPNTDRQDATNFLFVLLHFLDRHDPLTARIIERTCEELKYKDIFVYRYHNDDGLEGEEGAFLLCGYWLIAALAAVEEIDEAKRLFSRLEKQMPPSGLIAEEIDPVKGEYLGNFPQAFSHIGYIISAFYTPRYDRQQAAKKRASAAEKPPRKKRSS